MLACLYLLLGRSCREPQQSTAVAQNSAIWANDTAHIYCCTRHRRPQPPQLRVPQFRRLGPVAVSTAVEFCWGLGQICGLLTYCCGLLRLSTTPPQQQIYACEHASHLLHDVLYRDKRSSRRSTQPKPFYERPEKGLFCLDF